MSMSGYTSFLLSDLINQFLQDNITRGQLHESYKLIWDNTFLKRIRNGQRLQNFFSSKHISDLVMRVINPFPKIKSRLIEFSNGVPF